MTAAHTVQLPAGPAVEMDMTASGHRGNFVFFPRSGRSYAVVFFSGGSLRAESDFSKMLSSVQISG